MKKRGGMMNAREAARGSAPGGDMWVAVGRRLALRREELGYSADRVAATAGIPVDDFKDYENGAPIPAFSLARIAEALGRSVPWCFEGVARREPWDSETEIDVEPATYKVATVEHRIQALTESFRKLDFEGQQHLLAISRALSRANAGAARE